MIFQGIDTGRGTTRSQRIAAPGAFSPPAGNPIPEQAPGLTYFTPPPAVVGDDEYLIALQALYPLLAPSNAYQVGTTIYANEPITSYEAYSPFTYPMPQAAPAEDYYSQERAKAYVEALKKTWNWETSEGARWLAGIANVMSNYLPVGGGPPTTANIQAMQQALDPLLAMGSGQQLANYLPLAEMMVTPTLPGVPPPWTIGEPSPGQFTFYTPNAAYL